MPGSPIGLPSFTANTGRARANVAGSIAEPWWSSSPVVALVSTMRRHHKNSFEYQDLEQRSLFREITKWQAEATVPEQIPRIIRSGMVRALSDNPGPVYLGVPNDLMDAEYTEEAVPAAMQLARYGDMRYPLHRPRPDPDRVVQALQLIASADRPLLLAGNGVHASEAEAELVAVAEALQIPVVTSVSGKGAIPESHRLSAGTSGRYSRKYTNQLLSDADVVLAVGTRLGGMVTDSYRLISPETRLVQVDCESLAIGNVFPVEVGIQADAREFLNAMLEALPEVDLATGAAERDHWVEELVSKANAWRETRARLASAQQSPMRPEALMAVAQQELSDDTLVLADTGYAGAWVGALYELRKPGTGLLRADGSLGWAFPAALGAKLAAPDRPVVSIIGDGGVGYHVGEFETAARLGVPVVQIVLNNQSLAFEYHIQDMLYGAPVAEVDDFVDIDYSVVAKDHGLGGYRVSTPEEFRIALRSALSDERTTVIDAVIDRDAIAPVTRYDALRDREL